MNILDVYDVSIRYMTGDFKEIGLKEYVLRKLKDNYHVNEFWADKHISFTLGKGDMLGIIGTNGAGKSTLLKVVSGIMEPTGGYVKREGNIAALLELTSGFDGDLTVRENTYLRGAMLGYTRRFMDNKYDEIIDFAELKDFQDRPFKQLSSGMKSRLAFSIASLVQPDILILDEVLSVGDGAFRRKSEEKMREIINSGTTTILVSHAIEQVREMCNKVLWLEKGDQIGFGGTGLLCDFYQKYLDGEITLNDAKVQLEMAKTTGLGGGKEIRNALEQRKIPPQKQINKQSVLMAPPQEYSTEKGDVADSATETDSTDILPRRILGEPEKIFAGFWDKVPQYIRLTFLAAIILGLAAHLYMFTNKLPNHDDLNALFGLNYGVEFGRWFAPAILNTTGNLSMPWLIGSLSLLCLAGTACFTVSLLRIRHSGGCILTAAIVMMFPSVAATFTYMFLAEAYFLGVLIASSAAWVTVNWRKGFLLGIPMIALAMGLYQAYFSIAAVLMVGALLFEALDGQKTFTTLFLRGVKLVGTLAAGVAVYMEIVRITTINVQLADYQGISSMGEISLTEMPYRLKQCVETYFTFFIKDSYQIHFDFLRYLLPLAFLSAAVLVAMLLRQRKLEIKRVVLIGCLIVAYFFAANIVYLMNAENVHVLMVYGLCFVLLLPIGIADYLVDVPIEGHKAIIQVLLSWIIVVAMTATAYSYYLADNEAYFQQHMSFQQILAYSNRLVSKIEDCEGYEAGMEVVLVGSKHREPTLNPVANQQRSKLTGTLTMADYRTCWTYDRILHAFCGFGGAVYTEGSVQERDAANSAFVQAMPIYPQAGSCQVIDGQVVVRLN